MIYFYKLYISPKNLRFYQIHISKDKIKSYNYFCKEKVIIVLKR